MLATRPSWLRHSFATLLLATTAITAHAQWKPDRPVTLIVPFNTGGGADAVARPFAAELARIWSQPVIVDNRPGADTAIGTRRAIDSKPDGYTLLLQVPGVALFKHVPTGRFDALEGLTPITALTTQPPAITVNSKIPGKTLSEVMHYCKTVKEPCSIGTLEPLSRVEAKVLAADAGVDNMIFVRYRGSGPMLTDLMSNVVNMAFIGIAPTLAHHRSGVLRVVALHNKSRVSVLPEVQAGAETGFSVLDWDIWYGLFAPKGTPPEVVEGVAAAVREASKSDALRKALGAMSATSVISTPSDFAASVQATDRELSEFIRRFPLTE